jgi:hypothetical protein
LPRNPQIVEADVLLGVRNTQAERPKDIGSKGLENGNQEEEFGPKESSPHIREGCGICRALAFRQEIADVLVFTRLPVSVLYLKSARLDESAKFRVRRMPQMMVFKSRKSHGGENSARYGFQVLVESDLPAAAAFYVKADDQPATSSQDAMGFAKREFRVEDMVQNRPHVNRLKTVGGEGQVFPERAQKIKGLVHERIGFLQGLSFVPSQTHGKERIDCQVFLIRFKKGS